MAIRLAQLLEATEKPDEAAEVHRAVIAATDEADLLHAGTHLRLALLLLGKPNPDPEAAESHLRQAVAPATTVQQEASLHLGKLLAKKDPIEAADNLRRAIAGDVPGPALEATLLLAGELEQKGEREEAIDLYRSSATAHPWVAIRLADHLRAAGEAGIAEEIYRRAAELPAGSEFTADARLRLADILAATGRVPEACDAYREAIASMSIRVAPDAAVSLGELLESAGAPEAVADFYVSLGDWAASLTRDSPTFAVAFCRELGERLTASDQRAEARAVFLAAADSDSGVGSRLAQAIGLNGDRAGAELIHARLKERVAPA